MHLTVCETLTNRLKYWYPKLTRQAQKGATIIQEFRDRDGEQERKVMKVSFSLGRGSKRRLLDKRIMTEFPRLGAGDSRKQE